MSPEWVSAQADSGGATASEAIEQLLNAQIVLRNNRRLETAMRFSRLPAVKTLAEFDFAFQPSIKREQIEGLHELGFVDRAENVILLDPPGVGKTHLAISLAVAAAEYGRRVYYGTLAGLIEAKTAGNLARRLKVLTHPALLVVDLCEALIYVELAGLGTCFSREIREANPCRAQKCRPRQLWRQPHRSHDTKLLVLHVGGSVHTMCRAGAFAA